TAVGHATTPTGKDVDSNPDESTVTIVAATTLALHKTAEPSSVSHAGQTITYHYEETNTGTVTLHDLSIVETDFTGDGPKPDIDCRTTTLAPGAKVECTATYTVTQDDINAGTPIHNTATAHALTPGDKPVDSNPDESTVSIVAATTLALTKSATPSSVNHA